MPGAGRTHGPRAKKNARGGYHRFSRDIPAFPAQWLYGLYALSLGTGLIAPTWRQRASAAPDASTGASGPHDFAVRIELLVRMKTMLQPNAPTASRAQRP